jgi:hypothetical protein
MACLNLHEKECGKVYLVERVEGLDEALNLETHQNTYTPLTTVEENWQWD